MRDRLTRRDAAVLAVLSGGEWLASWQIRDEGAGLLHWWWRVVQAWFVWRPHAGQHIELGLASLVRRGLIEWKPGVNRWPDLPGISPRYRITPKGEATIALPPL